jgi:hypothetical protein
VTNESLFHFNVYVAAAWGDMLVLVLACVRFLMSNRCFNIFSRFVCLSTSCLLRRRRSDEYRNDRVIYEAIALFVNFASQLLNYVSRFFHQTLHILKLKISTQRHWPRQVKHFPTTDVKTDPENLFNLPFASRSPFTCLGPPYS